MIITDMPQSPEVGVYTPRPYVKRQYPLVRYASKTVYELMDIFLPEEGDGPFPVVIDIHGGGYFYGTRSSVRMEPVLNLIHRGYAVVTFDYTLSPYGKFPLQICELKAAVRYLRAYAKTYHIDPDHIAYWGLSAGAHIAALAAVSNGVKELEDLSMGNADFSSDVQAVVDLYGPVDVTLDDALEGEDPSRTMYATWLGKPVKNSAELVYLSNPCNFITEQSPPFFIQHGDADQMVSIKNSRMLYESILEKTGEKHVRFEVIPNADHADPLFRTRENNQKIYSFLDTYLKVK